MKFLVLGCNGMAGHVISLYLKENGHVVEGFARTKSEFIKTIVGDARDRELIKKTVQEGNYDSVINCIGILNQFAENNHDDAVLINSFLPHFLATITEKMETQIIHLSTDCVFSGKKGGYTEESFKDGVTFYDRTKALGELIDKKNVTLRSSIIGPDIKVNGIGLFNWFMKQTGEVKGYTKSMWTGQTTLQLAKTIEKVAEYKISGLINMVPNCNVSKYELLQLLNKYFKSNKIIVHGVEGVVADKTLIRTNFEFDYIIPGYETMISELLNWVRRHEQLYKHYDLNL